MTGSLLYYEVGNICNFACPFCIAESAKSRTVQPTAKLPPDRFQAILEVLAKIGFARLMVTGGEPLYYKDLPGILRIAHMAGYEIDVISNGAMVTTETVALFREIELGELIVSFESLDENVNRKLRTDRRSGRLAVETCLDAGVPVSINSVLTPDNLETLPDLLRWAHARGVAVALHPVSGPRVAVSEPGKRYRLDGINDQQKEALAAVLDLAALLFPNAAPSFAVIGDKFVRRTDTPKPERGCQIPKRSAFLSEDGTLSPCFYHARPYGNFMVDAWSMVLAQLEARVGSKTEEFKSCWKESCYGLVHEDFRFSGNTVKLF